MTENQRNYFFWNEKAFENAVKEIVCPECPYFDGNEECENEECRNPDPQGCALFRYLPDLVRVAQRLENANLKNYTEAVEKQVSFHCEQAKSSDNSCNFLDSPRCGLNKLLPYVLEAVLKADRGLETRPDFR